MDIPYLNLRDDITKFLMKPIAIQLYLHFDSYISVTVCSSYLFLFVKAARFSLSFVIICIGNQLINGKRLTFIIIVTTQNF